MRVEINEIANGQTIEKNQFNKTGSLKKISNFYRLPKERKREKTNYQYQESKRGLWYRL